MDTLGRNSGNAQSQTDNKCLHVIQMDCTVIRMDNNDYLSRTQIALSRIREDRKVTLESLSESTLIPYTTLHRKLSGVGDLTIREMVAICGSFGLTPAEFLASQVEGVERT